MILDPALKILRVIISFKKWLITYVTDVFVQFLPNSGRFRDRGATLWCRNPLLSPDNFYQGHSLKLKWLVTNAIAVRSPERAEHANLRIILVGRVFGQFRPHLWLGSHFVMWETPLKQ